MSRKNRKRKTVAIRAHMQGRKLKGIRKVKILSDEEFSYQDYVYLIDAFPPHAEINLDTTTVEPHRLYEGIYEKTATTGKKKKKHKVHKRTYAAQLYSNIGECSDVGPIFENQG